METNPLFNAFNSLMAMFGYKLRGDIFVASYGPNELRFYTEAIVEEDSELIGVFTANTPLDDDLELFKEVTESI